MAVQVSLARALPVLALAACGVSCGSTTEDGQMGADGTAAGGAAAAGGAPSAGGTGSTTSGAGGVAPGDAGSSAPCQAGSAGAASAGTGGTGDEDPVRDVSGEAGWAKALVEDHIPALVRTPGGQIVMALTRSERGWVVKRDAQGNLVWEAQPVDASACYGLAIAADDSIAVACTVGESPSRTAMLARYTGAGELVWSKRVAEGADVVGSELAQDSAGNLYLAGFVSGSADFGAGELTSLGSDAFLAKFAADGTHLFSRLYGDARRQWATRVTMTPDGSVVLGGEFAGAVDFGAGEVRTRGFGVTNLFVTELTPSAEPLQANRIVTGSPIANLLGLGASADRVCAAGLFDDVIELQNRAIASLGSHDLFVTCLDRAGAPIHGRTFGGPELDWGGLLAVDTDGSVLLASTLSGPVAIDEQCIGTPDGRVLALTELDPEGNVVRHSAFPVGPLSNVTSLVLERERVLFAGYFETELVLPMGALRMPSAAFLAELRR